MRYKWNKAKDPAGKEEARRSQGMAGRKKWASVMGASRERATGYLEKERRGNETAERCGGMG
jgi:hypothetical protein